MRGAIGSRRRRRAPQPPEPGQPAHTGQGVGRDQQEKIRRRSGRLWRRGFSPAVSRLGLAGLPGPRRDQQQQHARHRRVLRAQPGQRAERRALNGERHRATSPTSPIPRPPSRPAPRRIRDRSKSCAVTIGCAARDGQPAYGGRATRRRDIAKPSPLQCHRDRGEQGDEHERPAIACDRKRWRDDHGDANRMDRVDRPVETRHAVVRLQRAGVIGAIVAACMVVFDGEIVIASAGSA